MANFDREMEDLGRTIQEIVDRAINAGDFQKLNQNISKTVTRAVDLGSEAVRKAVDAAQSAQPSRTNGQVHEAEVVPKAKNLPVLYAKTGTRTTSGILKTVFGGIFTFTSALSLLVVALMSTVSSSAWLYGAFPSLILLGGGAMLSRGIKTLKHVGRFKTYRRVLGDKTQCTLDKLARAVGKNVKTVRKELEQMIHEGLFLEGHLDNEQTMLITSDETYQLFEQSRLQLEARQVATPVTPVTPAQTESAPISAQVQEVLDRGDAFLADIRKCNDDIPGEEISEKIYRIEKTVEKIFDRAETHPEIVPDLKKLMDYYLPMTVKLLRAYADMDALSIQGGTIQSSKKEIEATLDTLNLAFEKLLDDLFIETAIDVSSDISVLNTLLAQEGLTNDAITTRNQ